VPTGAPVPITVRGVFADRTKLRDGIVKLTS
jgi:hypothetical protein